ncbi:Copia protein [Durusdinium trenchii]|uniref:Copia protein n=1 Tax=Durusdinium trenchii TaxID=1381693 RepID=A0ABP0QMM1_9DINO
MTVTKSKDGIPAWDGTPSTWSEYRRAAYMYEETVKWESRYLCGPRLAAELTGAARTAIANKKRGWLSSQDGVGKLLRCLKETMSEPALPEISNQLKTYFKLLRRRRGESMVSFCVRHREEYARTCKALTRVMQEQKSLPDMTSQAWHSGRRQSVSTARPSTGGGSSDLATEGDTEATPTEDYDEEAQDETEWTWDDAWWWSTWETTWNWNLQSNTSIAEEDEDDEEDFVEILPDVIKGWLLLEKANLDGMERSLIQSEVKNNFSLANVEVALRSHFTDETIKKRDGEAKQALYENEEDETDVQIDTAYWKHPTSKKQVSFSLVMDEASRFLVGKVMRMDGGKGVKASEYAELFANHWFPYFGMPDVVRSDPEGAFRSEEMLNFFSERGIHLDHIPAEAHWNLSHVERCIERVKEFLTKTAGDAEQDVIQLIQHAIYTWNHREIVRGYSPFQHAIGRQPDIEGRVFDRRTTDLPMEMMQSPDGEMEVASQLRQQASKAFIDWQAQEKLTRARNSKHHPHKDFFPGDLVFYWRTQLGNAERQNSWNRGNYVGPARVLAVETRQEHGQLRASSVVWLVRGNRLVKAAQEQLRPASMRETCLHELTRPPQLPWTFNSLAGDLHKASFQDHTGPGPSENKRSLVEPEELDDTEHPTNRRRVTGKQQQSRQQDRSRSPKPSRSEDAALFTGPSWQELVPESAWLTTDTRTTWDNPHAAVELTLELPTDQRKLKRFMNNPVAYFVSALKRRSVEVSERHLSALEHEQFAGSHSTKI